MGTEKRKEKPFCRTAEHTDGGTVAGGADPGGRRNPSGTHELSVDARRGAALRGSNRMAPSPRRLTTDHTDGHGWSLDDPCSSVESVVSGSCCLRGKQERAVHHSAIWLNLWRRTRSPNSSGSLCTQWFTPFFGRRPRCRFPTAFVPFVTFCRQPRPPPHFCHAVRSHTTLGPKALGLIPQILRRAPNHMARLRFIFRVSGRIPIQAGATSLRPPNAPS